MPSRTRIALGALLISSLLGVVGVACTGPAPATPPPDASAPDSSVADAADASDAALVGTPVYVVNNLVTVQSNVRLCFAAAPSGTPAMSDVIASEPVPSGAGAAAGYVAPTFLPAGLGTGSVSVVAYYVDSLKAFQLDKKNCRELAALSLRAPATDGGADAAAPTLDAGVALVERADFEVSKPLAASLFAQPTAPIVFVTGCPKASDPGTLIDNYCGNKNEALGAFDVYVFNPDPTAPAPGSTRLQPLFGVTTVNYPPPIPGFDLAVHYKDGGSFAFPAADGGFVPFEVSGPLQPASEVPSLASASSFTVKDTFYASDDSVSRVLEASGLPPAAKLDSTFTMLVLGDPFSGDRLDDGGANPRHLGVRLIPSR